VSVDPAYASAISYDANGTSLKTLNTLMSEHQAIKSASFTIDNA
jgi:hypothetical protein